MIKPLAGGVDTARAVAQELALNASQVQKKLQDPKTGLPLQAEVFAIYPVSGDELGSGHEKCQDTGCYRVDIYDWARNATVSAWVDTTRERVVAVQRLPDSSPELPEYWVQQAISLAQNDERVRNALAAAQKSHSAPDMARVRTSLNDTACELSRHLCVAPTFELGDKALWAIVDLTAQRVVGVKWTDLGDYDADLPTESNLVKHQIYRDYCRGPVALKRDGWEMQYQLTASDGLRLSSVKFRGQPVLQDVRLVDYHVSYSNKEGFGYNDAIGCPLFSSAAVAAFAPPQITALNSAEKKKKSPSPQDGAKEPNRLTTVDEKASYSTVSKDVASPNEPNQGFEIVQDFRHPLWPKPCNYRYQQRYRFYADGSYSIAAANLGRGCGAHAVYRFLFRIQPAFYPGQHWLKLSADGYQPVTRESWQSWPEQGSSDSSLPPWQWRTTAFSYAVRPIFEPPAGGRAYVYLVRQTADENSSNLPTLGSCCHLDHRQGPESLIDNPPQSIDDGRWVLWYVPVIENNPDPGQERCWAETRLVNGVYQVKVWPCWAGLSFQRQPLTTESAAENRTSTAH